MVLPNIVYKSNKILATVQMDPLRCWLLLLWNASLRICSKMQTFVTKYYVEPENIPTEIVQDEDEVIFNVTRTS